MMRKLRRKLFWWLFDREIGAFTREQVDALNRAIDGPKFPYNIGDYRLAAEARVKVMKMMEGTYR